MPSEKRAGKICKPGWRRVNLRGLSKMEGQGGVRSRHGGGMLGRRRGWSDGGGGRVNGQGAHLYILFHLLVSPAKARDKKAAASAKQEIRRRNTSRLDFHLPNRRK